MVSRGIVSPPPVPRVGISGYVFLDKKHLLDSDSFYLVAGYSWIWISFCYRSRIILDLDTKISKILSKEFKIGYKFQKSYPHDLGLDTNSKFGICIQRMWIQLFENVTAKSSRCNERFQKTNRGFRTPKIHFKEILGHFLFQNIVNHRFYEKCLRFIDFLAFFNIFFSVCFHNI